MQLVKSAEKPLGEGKIEYRLEVRLAADEARYVMAKKDLFAREGIPLDPFVRLVGVPVFIDTPLQIAGAMIADEDTTARFACTTAEYDGVVRALDAYLRDKLACIWAP